MLSVQHMNGRTPSGFQVALPHFTTETFPPYLASPFWYTAPLAPAPKFVVMPINDELLPGYNWGDYGGTDGKRKRAIKKAAKLRAKAKKFTKEAEKVERKAGIKKPVKTLKQVVHATVQTRSKPEEVEPEEASPLEAPDVPQNAEEGAANMKLIIGGTVALMAAAGIAFLMQKQKAKKASVLAENEETRAA